MPNTCRTVISYMTFTPEPDTDIKFKLYFCASRFNDSPNKVTKLSLLLILSGNKDLKYRHNPYVKYVLDLPH